MVFIEKESLLAIFLSNPNSIFLAASLLVIVILCICFCWGVFRRRKPSKEPEETWANAIADIDKDKGEDEEESSDGSWNEGDSEEDSSYANGSNGNTDDGSRSLEGVDVMMSEFTENDDTENSKKRFSRASRNMSRHKSAGDVCMSSSTSTALMLAGVDHREWVERLSATRQMPYWKNSRTGRSTWKNPFMVASGGKGDLRRQQSAPQVFVSAAPPSTGGMEMQWVEKFSETKKKPYWKNTHTGRSTWKNPFVGFQRAHSEKYLPHTGTMLVQTPLPSHSAGLLAVAGTVATLPVDPSSEWEEKFSEIKHQPYWKHKSTGRSTWTRPYDISEGHTATTASALPRVISSAAAPVPGNSADDWEERFSSTKQVPYWKHKITRQTSWKPTLDVDVGKERAPEAAPPTPPPLPGAGAGSETVSSPAPPVAPGVNTRHSASQAVMPAPVSSADEREERFSDRKQDTHLKYKIPRQTSWKPVLNTKPSVSSRALTSHAVAISIIRGSKRRPVPNQDKICIVLEILCSVSGFT
jgi:hypothetical protein